MAKAGCLFFRNGVTVNFSVLYRGVHTQEQIAQACAIQGEEPDRRWNQTVPLGTVLWPQQESNGDDNNFILQPVNTGRGWGGGKTSIPCTPGCSCLLKNPWKVSQEREALPSLVLTAGWLLHISQHVAIYGFGQNNRTAQLQSVRLLSPHFSSTLSFLFLWQWIGCFAPRNTLNATGGR